MDINAKCVVILYRWLKCFRPTWKLHHKFSTWFFDMWKFLKWFSFKWSILFFRRIIIFFKNFDCQWRQCKSSWSGVSSSDYTLYSGVWLSVKIMKTYVLFSIKMEIVGIGWKYTYWISLTSLIFVNEERVQDYI